MHQTTPSDLSLDVIREHLTEAHGETGVDLTVQVTSPGHLAQAERIVYLPGRPGAVARFVCVRREGQTFHAAPPTYGDPLRNAALLRHVPVL